MEEMLEKMFFTTSTGNVPLLASSISLAQNTCEQRESHPEVFTVDRFAVEIFLRAFLFVFCMLYLVQQVQSCHVGLLCVQKLTGNLKQLLFICLLETEKIWTFLHRF